jgi:bifunctional ADP-heptose synthase (sugar kinase/adenylyltransferase)
LERAARLGSYLVVAVTSDAQVTKQKGEGRPVFPVGERAQMLYALRVVNRVIVVDNLIEALYQVDPDVLALGAEYEGRVEQQHQAFCDLHKIDIVFTNGPVYSSTRLLSHYRRRQRPMVIG